MKHRNKFLIRISVLAAALCLCGTVSLWALLDENSLPVRLLSLTRFAIDKPAAFGAFHLICLSVCILLGILAACLAQKLTREQLDRAVFLAGLFLLAMEVYKQLYYHTVIGNGHYNFSILPMQVCSYALWLFIPTPLLPEGRLKETLYSFCSLYLTMGGCLVMAYPVFYPDASLCLHTMLWHTVMIFVGILILSIRTVRLPYLRAMAGSTAVFLCTVLLAVSLNYLLTPLTDNSAAPLNLFYMSPYQTNNYFLISDVRERFGWLPSLFTYVALFIFVGAHTVWGAGWLIRTIFSLKNRRKNRSLS